MYDTNDDTAVYTPPLMVYGERGSGSRKAVGLAGKMRLKEINRFVP